MDAIRAGLFCDIEPPFHTHSRLRRQWIVGDVATDDRWQAAYILRARDVDPLVFVVSIETGGKFAVPREQIHDTRRTPSFQPTFKGES